MRLITFVLPGARHSRPGALLGQRVVDLSQAIQWARRQGLQPGTQSLGRGAVPRTMLELVARGQDYLQACSSLVARVDGDSAARQELARQGAVRPLAEVRLRAPVERPPSMRDFMAFEGHIKTMRGRRGQEVMREWYEVPAFYFSNANAVYGPEGRIPQPQLTNNLDYELEVACIIGEGGMNIREEEADRHIAGFTIWNDWSARDVQGHEMQIGLGPSKGKDFAQSLGPCIVTLDELQERALGDGRYDLAMTSRVNGKDYSRGNFKDVYWTFRQMVAHASRDVYLNPGDVLGSGTVGTGCIAELGGDRYGWLRPGDVVELNIECIGVLRNTITRRRPRRAEAAKRTR